jgi:DnaJ domain
MEDLPDHYAALGISSTADQEVIAAAYRALAKKFHPDSGTSRGSASPERFAAVQDAWETLGEPERRRRYDAMRSRALPPHARAAPLPRAGTPVARGDTVTPAARPHALAGERRIKDPAPERRRGAIAPIFGIAGALAVVLLAVLWLMSLWLSTPGRETAALIEPKLPAIVETSATLPAVDAPAQTRSVAPVPKRKPAPPRQPEEQALGEVLFALSILPQAGGDPSDAGPAQVMFSTRNKCESFGAETLERRRAAALNRNEPEPQERFACVEFSGKAP